jgi:hypothetical protein
MPISVVNRVYWNVSQEDSQTPTADASGSALDATIDVANGSSPSGQANARTAEATATAFGAFAGGAAEISHGEQLPALSADVAAVIGPTGTLTPWTGSMTFSGTQTISDRSFSGVVDIAAGANITFSNCRFVGTLGSATYTIRCLTDTGGARVTLLDCEVITRATTSKSPRCITVWGTNNARAERTIFRGGIDNIFHNPSNVPGLFATGDPVVPFASGWYVNCWFGDYQRVGTSHSDAFQCDGGGYLLIDACRIMAYNVPQGSDPLTTRVTDPFADELGGGGMLLTQDSGKPVQISNVAVRRSWLEGGNYTADLAPSDGLPVRDTSVTDCRFGRRTRYGALRTNGENRRNTWGQSGQTGADLNGAVVTAGQLVPGSTA